MKATCIDVLVLGAVLLTLHSAWLMLRMKDEYQMMHFMSPPASLSAGLMVIAIFLQRGFKPESFKAAVHYGCFLSVRRFGKTEPPQSWLCLLLVDGISSLLIGQHEVLEEVFVGISDGLSRPLLRSATDVRIMLRHLRTQMTDDGLHDSDGNIRLRAR